MDGYVSVFLSTSPPSYWASWTLDRLSEHLQPYAATLAMRLKADYPPPCQLRCASLPILSGVENCMRLDDPEAGVSVRVFGQYDFTTNSGAWAGVVAQVLVQPADPLILTHVMVYPDPNYPGIVLSPAPPPLCVWPRALALGGLEP